MKITADVMLKIMKNTLEVMKQNEKFLTDLDAIIGDADHGVNMVRGFTLVNERLASLNNPDVGTIWNTAGMALMETVGGAAGPLYGFLYLQASNPVKGKREVGKEEIAAMIHAGMKGVQQIGGGTVPGEKTMVDALDPAVKVLKEVVNDENVTLIAALEKAVEAAKKGMKDTIPMLAKKGRASYLGERSIGHQDPGATSTYLILQTMVDTLNGKTGLKVKKYGSDGAILETAYF